MFLKERLGEFRARHDLDKVDYSKELKNNRCPNLSHVFDIRYIFRPVFAFTDSRSALSIDRASFAAVFNGQLYYKVLQQQTIAEIIIILILHHPRLSDTQYTYTSFLTI
jgi:hypothetical protein